jgi:hypothetical protein
MSDWASGRTWMGLTDSRGCLGETARPTPETAGTIGRRYVMAGLSIGIKARGKRESNVLADTSHGAKKARLGRASDTGIARRKKETCAVAIGPMVRRNHCRRVVALGTMA